MSLQYSFTNGNSKPISLRPTFQLQLIFCKCGEDW